MGTFKALSGLRFLNWARFTNDDSSSANCPPIYKMGNATPVTSMYVYNGNGAAMLSLLEGMKSMSAYATADTISDYDVNDYTVNAVGTTTMAQTVNSSSGVAVCTVTVSATSETTFSCIKFVNTGVGWRESGGSSPKNHMMACYYLDNPITLNESNGYSAVITIDFYS